jgi:chemosensory pili system protein ChpA (sensor histidine kinase/response regulator)
MSTPTSVSAPGVRDNFDAGSLSWVMGEIREALTKSKTALFDALAQDADVQSTSLRHAKSYLHQADGALQIVDIDGVAIITETTEDLFNRIEAGQIVLTEEVARVIEKAYQALAEYLEELLSGGAHQPVRLFPYYRALLELRGAERIHPADLFFPTMSARPTLPVATNAGTNINYLQLRKRFELALLPFLKQADTTAPPTAGVSAASGLEAIIAEIEQAQTNAQSQSFWWVLHGFAEGVVSAQIPSERYVKQLFARINLQIRRLSEGSHSIAERLMRDALFFIARIAEPSARARQIQQAYGLAGLVPADYAIQRYGQIDAALLLQAREALTQAKTLWNRIASGDASVAELYEVEIRHLMEIGSKLGSASLSKLLRELNGIARLAGSGDGNQPAVCRKCVKQYRPARRHILDPRRCADCASAVDCRG